MDVFRSLVLGDESLQIRTVGMHTAGEPTRIIIQGFPLLEGRTLLEKRAFAKARHDDVRKRLMHEPRGHQDMYGAILVQETELVKSGIADIGVLFCHNEGFSTMCGHATLALGRFLVDTQDIVVFPRRNLLPVDFLDRRTTLTLHAPCGPVHISVPIVPSAGSEETRVVKSDPSRPVWFLSVPSFAAATDFVLRIPSAYCWPELLAAPSRDVKFDIGFGGAFYVVVSVQALGFPGEQSLDAGIDSSKYGITALDRATRLLKACLSESPEIRALLQHPTSPELEYLYGIIVVDPTRPRSPLDNSEVGICFFADQQIDRSPCGSGVCARVALAIAKGERQVDVPWIYHSLVTKRKGEGPFTACAVERVVLKSDSKVAGNEGVWEAWVVKVEGNGYYTDATTFVLEGGDSISREGFIL